MYNIWKPFDLLNGFNSTGLTKKKNNLHPLKLINETLVGASNDQHLCMTITLQGEDVRGVSYLEL